MRRAYCRLALVLLSLTAASTADDALCAACYHSYRLLNRVLNDTKTELELSKEANDKKAKKVDKVQKAQTKRWLKNEYRVALRAGLEEELEMLCSRDQMTSSDALRLACMRFVESHEEELPRAVLDEKPVDPFCAESVPGCVGEAATAALKQHMKQGKSEAVPKAKPKLVRGAVMRLVGKTYSKAVRATSNQHVLVLVHAKAKSGPQPREASDVRYASLIAEFYALAAAVTSSSGPEKERFKFGQIDVTKNDVPSTTPLADASGVSLLLYGLGELGHDPKSMPAVGEKPLSFAEAASVRTQLTQFLLMHLPKRDHGLVTKMMKDREKGTDDAAAKPADAPADAAAADAKGAAAADAKPKPAPAPATPAPARRKAPAATKVELSQRRAQDCDVCVLVMGELASTLNATVAELELSHEAASRKQSQIDGVQKAQTKRWLKNEYKVALAEAVEDRIETVCNSSALFDVVCDLEAEQRREQWEDLGPKGRSPSACAEVGKGRCKALTEERAEELVRAALDKAGWASCAKIVRGCEPEDLEGEEEEEEAGAAAVSEAVREAAKKEEHEKRMAQMKDADAKRAAERAAKRAAREPAPKDEV